MPKVDILIIGLNAPLSFLYERIDKRVDERMKNGAFAEVETLQKKYSWDLPSMSSLGYKQWRNYFTSAQKLENQDAIVQQWKYDEHAYARRQLTWFSKNSQINWFDISKGDCVDKVVESVQAWYTRNTHDIKD